MKTSPLISNKNQGLSRFVRRGFSLLEILLSLALLAVAMSGIGQLLETGLQAALRNQLRTEGQFLCEGKLAELIIDPTAQQTTGETDFPDHPQWRWSVVTSEGPRTDLLRLEVAAIHYTEEQSPREDMRVTLVRLIRVPTTPPTEETTTSRTRTDLGGAI